MNKVLNRMKKLFIMLAILPVMSMAQTLEECQHAAERNYPLIRKYDLIAQTTDLTVSNVGKGWLPKISASAQATYQSDVTAWPDEMKDMLNQMGVELKGLKKDQYRIGIDINQTIYDGGVLKNQKEIARQQGNIQMAENEVNLYAIKKQVNEMYFGLLLLDEQIRLNENLQELLMANERKLSSMCKNGTAAESDFHSLKAERLSVQQEMTELHSRKSALQTMLSIFCGIEVKNIEKPTAELTGGNGRPELLLFDSQLKMMEAQEKMLNSNLRPTLSLFASGFYGYPGYNLFEDMYRHAWSLNGIIGARLTWNVGTLYTRKNDNAKLRLQKDLVENNREVFLFNNNLQQIQQNENIERYRKTVSEDDEIIQLRTSVRQAAESKLEHGIIDVNDLVKEINSENAAKVRQSMHEIEMLKEIYDLKYLTNK